MVTVASVPTAWAVLRNMGEVVPISDFEGEYSPPAEEVEAEVEGPFQESLALQRREIRIKRSPPHL